MQTDSNGYFIPNKKSVAFMFVSISNRNLAMLSCLSPASRLKSRTTSSELCDETFSCLVQFVKKNGGEFSENIVIVTFLRNTFILISLLPDQISVLEVYLYHRSGQFDK